MKNVIGANYRAKEVSPWVQVVDRGQALSARLDRLEALLLPVNSARRRRRSKPVSSGLDGAQVKAVEAVLSRLEVRLQKLSKLSCKNPVDSAVGHVDQAPETHP